MVTLPKFKRPIEDLAATPARDFGATLKERVDAWFRERARGKQGDWAMAPRAGLAFGTLVASYLTLLLGDLPLGLGLAAWAWVGASIAFVAMSVGHDAAHGSFSRSHRVNELFTWTLDLLGVNARNWQVEHNTLHHGYTNIPGADLNIELPPPAGRVVRLHDHLPLLRAHRWQHLYAPLLYCSLTLSIVFVNDLRFAVRRHPQTGKLPTPANHLRNLLGKACHVGLLLVVPARVLPGPLWQVALGFLTLHMTAGLILGTLFQLAHLIEGAEVVHVAPGDDVPMGWMEHQARTTTNFCAGSALANWLTGGLSHQLEHHLFPTISHVHYPELSAIVARTCQEFAIPYRDHPTFLGALRAHLRHLKALGQADRLPGPMRAG